MGIEAYPEFMDIVLGVVVASAAAAKRCAVFAEMPARDAIEPESVVAPLLHLRVTADAPG